MTATNPARPPTPNRRLQHRIPRSLRQHWKLLAVFVAFVTVMTTVFGAARIRPYITGDASVIASPVTENIAGAVDLFDTSVGHELSLDIPAAELGDMLSAYEKTGDKKWVNATVTIDGTLIGDVAVRLKGNSTLLGLRGGGAGGPRGMGGRMASVSADDPTTLPLLLSFDEYADGRAYQGITELSVRPGTPVVNEAMALSLTAATDQPTQRFSYSEYSINGGVTTMRLLLEHPDDGYANSLFDSDGYLYKAKADSRFAYVDDDQSSYSEQFEQINAVDSGNLQPIIAFLKWLDSADDVEFDAHLTDWVDIDSFARYLATQNLLVNSDDMSGPGQNYYLWYDLGTEKISVVSWDLNLAMTGGTDAGPHDTVSTGPGAAPQGMPPGRPGAPQGGPGMPQMPQGMPDGGAMRGGNTLKTRFLDSDAFTGVYEQAYWDLYEQMYGSSRADEILDALAASIPTSDGLTADALQDSIDEMRTWIGQRTTALDDRRDR
ncbi:CotH kinase family protein [Prescottella subtropica]|uniref:CotH kinase family protein n=1 Tax=Prescottella subtropica TaxID=2545757 RepID=UPI0014798152|nr:CotH kinase family protein [Prescottella subtropica]